MKVIRKPRVSPRVHTLKRLPHTETSYALLAFVVILGGVVLAGFTKTTLADMTDPISGSYTILTTVLGQPPSVGATITTPIDNQRFGDSRIDVRGSCAPGRIVKMTKNDVFAGSVLCDPSGHYVMSISLFVGANSLVANNYDFADQAGPVTPGLTVYYDLASVSGNGPVAEAPVPNLVIDSPTKFQAGYVGNTLSWTFIVTGGVPPYAVYVDWGDGSSDVVTRSTPGSFQLTHRYGRPGPVSDSYNVGISVTDIRSHQAFAQFSAIVRSQLTALSTTKGESGGGLSIAWPMFAIAGMMVLLFWLGEQAVKWRLGTSLDQVGGV